jgi:hypothetical protein
MVCGKGGCFAVVAFFSKFARVELRMLSLRKILLFIGAILLLIGGVSLLFFPQEKRVVTHERSKDNYWFVLYRKSNKEELYRGIPGDKERSKLLKTFRVKSGIPGERPTPLPQLVGREYWLITKKESSAENPETAPYFITLDIPAPTEPPYGPVPYEECDGQCDWILPGAFGLHGVNGDISRLSDENPGSSGCVRHSDEDITYLYQLLDPQKSEIRYYIKDE